MKQEQPNSNVCHENRGYRMTNPALQGLASFKTIVVAGWFALGNVLLLIGGDDSVEIGFKSLPIQLLNQSQIQLSPDSNEGHSA